MKKSYLKITLRISISNKQLILRGGKEKNKSNIRNNNTK